MLPTTQITLDVTAYQLTDKQLARLRQAFHLLLRKANEHAKGSVSIPFDDEGVPGLAKVESFYNYDERKNGVSNSS